MNDLTPNTEPTSDIDHIKSDLASLYTHVGSILGRKTEDAKARWSETQTSLEERRKIVEERSKELASAGSAATSEMKAGFTAAFAELKKSFIEAKAKFEAE